MRIFAVLATALVASVAAGPSFGPDVDSDAQSLRLERRSSLEKRGAAKVRARLAVMVGHCVKRERTRRYAV